MLQSATPTGVLPPALIVIGGGARVVASPPPPAADSVWLAALPAARHVLAVGSDAIAMAGAYQRQHHAALWSSAGLAHEAPGLPALGETGELPDAVNPPAGGFDLLLLGSAFASQPHAAERLRTLSKIVAADARLFAAFDNAASAPHIESLLQADLSPDDATLEASAAPQAPATFYKMLMDAGWMPSLAAHHACAPANDKVARALRYTADALGVGAGSVDVVHRMSRLIVEARRAFDEPSDQDVAAAFTVVVPTNDERQLRANVERSPGLQEVNARIVSYRGAQNPAEALEQSLSHCETDWVLLSHQDVYFPRGFGRQLNAVLAAIPAADRARSLIGFIGMGVDRSTRQPVPAGHVIDRLHRADHPASDAVLSIDEVAIVLSRDSVHRIDPAIGWHLWATDLCLTAIAEHKVFPRIVRLPLFHNSRTGWSLPARFLDAAERLLAKHPAFGPIHTLCGTLDASFVATHRGALK